VPPWAVGVGSKQYNFSTGTFGAPKEQRYVEAPDGSFRVDANREKPGTWRVDVDLLPAAQRGAVREQMMRSELTAAAAADDPELAALRKKAAAPRYQRFMGAVERAKARRAAEKEEVVRPLPPRVRMSQMLRQGVKPVAPVRQPARQE
jgi:hypothetical protein